MNIIESNPVSDKAKVRSESDGIVQYRRYLGPTDMTDSMQSDVLYQIITEEEFFAGRQLEITINTADRDTSLNPESEVTTFSLPLTDGVDAFFDELRALVERTTSYLSDHSERIFMSNATATPGYNVDELLNTSYGKQIASILAELPTT